jgi:hypothetical protein
MTLIPTLNIFFQKMCSTIQVISNNNNNIKRTSTQTIKKKKKLLCKHCVFDANVKVTILDSLSGKFKHPY